MLAACTTPPPSAPRINGKSLITSRATEMYVSPNGTWAASLIDAEPTKEPGAPADILLGSLWIAPIDGGQARRLGGEVSNLPGSVFFSKDGAYIAFLASFSVHSGVGELRLAKSSGGEPESLGEGVTFFSISPESDRIAWIVDGVLFLRKLAGGSNVRVTDAVSLVEFAPNDTPLAGKMLVKRSIRQGGALLMDDLATGKLTAIARGVTGFGFAPNGTGYAFHAMALLPPSAVEKPIDAASGHGIGVDAPGLYQAVGHDAPKLVTAEGVSDFKFSPAGTRLAYLSLPSANGSSDLYIYDGGTPEHAATKVSQIRFAPDGTIVLLANFSQGGNAGTLGALPPKGDLQQIATNVRQFTLSAKGTYVLYTCEVFHSGVFTPGFAIHKLGTPPSAKPQMIDEGVFGYVSDADDVRVAYKGKCYDDGRSCNLYVANLADPKPVQVADHVATFDFGPEGLVVATSRSDGTLTGRTYYSLGYLRSEPRAPVMTLEDWMSGEFTFVGPKKSRLVYLVGESGREGLFTVELKTPPPVPPLPTSAPPAGSPAPH